MAIGKKIDFDIENAIPNGVYMDPVTTQCFVVYGSFKAGDVWSVKTWDVQSGERKTQIAVPDHAPWNLYANVENPDLLRIVLSKVLGDTEDDINNLKGKIAALEPVHDCVKSLLSSVGGEM
jgi:hypothetical protein